MGPDEHDPQKITVLNREVIFGVQMGIAIEADTRHVDIILKDSGLEKRGAKGIANMIAEDQVDETPLDAQEAIQYGSMVARLNYLSQDRSDIQFAVKEVCRGMSKPTEGDVLKLKRLGRYLKDHPRLVLGFALRSGTGR